MRDEHLRGDAAFADLRRLVAKIDPRRSADDLAADLIDFWSELETVLRRMLGGSPLGGQALIREVYQRHMVTSDQAHALLEFLAVRERCDSVSYKPTPEDVAAAKEAFSQLHSDSSPAEPEPATVPVRGVSPTRQVVFGLVVLVFFGLGAWLWQGERLSNTGLAGNSVELSLITMFAAGAVIMTYDDVAIAHGWPIGGWMRGPHPVLAVGAILSVLAAIGLSFVAGPWWQFAITIFVGFLFAKIFTFLLKMWAQGAVLVLMPASWIWAYIVFTKVR